MLNDSKWVEVGETVFELRNNEDTLIATLSYDERYYLWQIDYELNCDFKNFSTTFQATTTDEAKRKATVEIHDECNRKISYYMSIRDHLPSLGELYDHIK